MIGSQDADCKDAHATVSFPDFSHAGEQGSAKSPPRGQPFHSELLAFAGAALFELFKGAGLDARRSREPNRKALGEDKAKMISSRHVLRKYAPFAKGLWVNSYGIHWVANPY